MKTEVELDQEQARLTQRVLAIPGVELITSTDSVDYTSPLAHLPKAERGEGKKVPSRDLLFSRVWLGFGVDDDPEKARQVFETKFGHKPEFVHQDLPGKMLWVGPV